MALFHRKIESSFFHFHIIPEILAKLFNLIYYLILTPTLTLTPQLSPPTLTLNPNQMCADEYRSLLFFTLLNNFFR